MEYKEFSRRYLLISLVVFLSISGCTYLAKLQSPYKKLIGAWQFKDPSQGPLILTFRKDKTYEVDHNADGKKDIWGTFSVHDGRVRFVDDEPRVTTDCYEPGFHTYSVVNDELTFELFADQCLPRKYILKLGWVRANKD